jgi:calcium permeable stress-gated cation channel
MFLLLKSCILNYSFQVLTFILTNTFTAAASTNSRLVPVVLSKLAFIFRGKTPRKAFAYDYKMGAIALATTWPPIALLGCIAIVYTPIQPIVPGFAVVGLFLYVHMGLFQVSFKLTLLQLVHGLQVPHYLGHGSARSP